ncbi:MAG: ribonuclease HII [Clostridia bacterium]|nr:ribonuclease HII [Clostridia bacterium]
MKNTLEIENNCIEKGYKLIAGVDEAGRGPLAGPVVSACVIMPLDDIIEGVDDSKKLSEKKRDLLFDKIVEKAIAYKISVVSEKVIDEINILNATKMSMKECIEGMEIKPDIVLVDAVKLEMEVPCVPIIHGDALSYSIAAASILAKVSRDRIMQEYDKVYPQYLFAKHKGYGTKMHIEAIKEHGSCEIHRKTFITRFI